MSLYINFVDAFLDTEFPNLTSEERDVLRAVVTHDLYTSEQIRGILLANPEMSFHCTSGRFLMDTIRIDITS
jgi:hypothetical protein